MAERAKAEIGGPDFGRAARQLAKRPTLRTLAIFYWARVKAQPLRELFALVGIAAGAALLFAVQINNQSVTGSAEQLAHAIGGRATLEMSARGPAGFDQRIFRKVERLGSVEGAAPVLERRVAVIGPRGRRVLTLFGVDKRLARIGGPLVRQAVRNDRGPAGLGLQLPAPVAKAIGVDPGQTLDLEVGERTVRIPLADSLSGDAVGPVAQSPVAVAPLGFTQDLARMQGRLTRLLVAPLPARRGEAEAALRRVAANRLAVRPSDTEAKLLSEAATAERRASEFWSAVSVAIGILLAYSAMLLTIPERRVVVSTLRMLGAGRRAILASLVFDALALGLAGSVVGLLLGDQLSRHLLQQVPAYLAPAFPIGSQRIIAPEAIVIAVAGGTLAAVAAAARPALALLGARPLETVSKDDAGSTATRSHAARKRLLWGGLALIAATIALALPLPQTLVVGSGVLALGMVMLLPALVTYLLTYAQRLARWRGSAISHLSLAELTATPTRATALVATVAVACFAIVSLSGGLNDMRRGVNQATTDFFGNADLWVSPDRKENTFMSVPFDDRTIAPRLAEVPEVRSVRAYRGGFVDLENGWRVWMIGLPRTDPKLIPPVDIVDGDLKTATRRLRAGGWAALSATLARNLDLKPGQALRLDTPAGTRSFRLAATVTNGGWASGMLMINATDIARSWGAKHVSALELDLRDGVPAAQGRAAVERALGGSSPLRVTTLAENVSLTRATTNQGLARVDQISKMVLLAAALAIVVAMLAAVWQRRQRITTLTALGMSAGQVYRALVAEIGMILMVGCAIGAAFGLVDQWLTDRWGKLVMGYPIIFSPALGLALQTIALAAALAIVATLIPARLSLRFSPQATFSPE